MASGSPAEEPLGGTTVQHVADRLVGLSGALPPPPHPQLHRHPPFPSSSSSTSWASHGLTAVQRQALACASAAALVEGAVTWPAEAAKIVAQSTAQPGVFPTVSESFRAARNVPSHVATQAAVLHVASRAPALAARFSVYHLSCAYQLDGTGRVAPTWAESSLAGACAGVAEASLATPFDLVKTRLVAATPLLPASLLGRTAPAAALRSSAGTGTGSGIGIGSAGTDAFGPGHRNPGAAGLHVDARAYAGANEHAGAHIHSTTGVSAVSHSLQDSHASSPASAAAQPHSRSHALGQGVRMHVHALGPARAQPHARTHVLDDSLRHRQQQQQQQQHPLSSTQTVRGAHAVTMRASQRSVAEEGRGVCRDGHSAVGDRGSSSNFSSSTTTTSTVQRLKSSSGARLASAEVGAALPPAPAAPAAAAASGMVRATRNSNLQHSTVGLHCHHHHQNNQQHRLLLQSQRGCFASATAAATAAATSPCPTTAAAHMGTAAQLQSTTLQHFAPVRWAAQAISNSGGGGSSGAGGGSGSSSSSSSSRRGLHVQAALKKYPWLPTRRVPSELTLEVLRETVREEGVSRLWRGWRTAVARDACFGAVFFPVWLELERSVRELSRLLEEGGTGEEENWDVIEGLVPDAPLGPLQSATAAAAAAAAAAVVSHPLDSAKTRTQCTVMPSFMRTELRLLRFRGDGQWWHTLLGLRWWEVGTHWQGLRVRTLQQAASAGVLVATYRGLSQLVGGGGESLGES